MMMTIKYIAAAALTVLALTSGAVAAEAGAPIEKQPWTFAGVFGTYDENQLQRGFQVYREVCASCHGARLMAFRNLAEPGGPGFTEGQVRALAAEYEIRDPLADTGVRPGVPADRWPSPFASAREAAEANGGVAPPDFSVIAKARSVSTPFPWWILNYFTGYSEGGPDYIHALLTGYHEEVPATAPEGFELPPGSYYNDAFPGHAIAMAPPLADGVVTYADSSFPQTLDQYSRDVSAFLMWVAEPHLVSRKQTGFGVILFLFLFAGLIWMVKEKLWAEVHHQEKLEAEKASAGKS